jgi:DNA-directed RNA polymerase specialized sigma24 family protein
VTTASAEEEQADAQAAVERFEDFYLREFRAVVGLAYLLSGRSMVSEDIAQEAFMAAHRGWERVSRYDDPGAWVRKVAVGDLLGVVADELDPPGSRR